MNAYQKHLGGYESAFYYQHTLKEKEEGKIILNFIKKRRKTERGEIDCILLYTNASEQKDKI